MKATEVKLGMKVCACMSWKGKKRKHEPENHCIVSSVTAHYKRGVSALYLDFPGIGTKDTGEWEPRSIHKIKNWRPGPSEKVIK